ncbi:phosphate:H+ symporter [Microthyrium microscopicum]|uniref:Phosphate:H+ symporter n=1 Tax=Microthyrium microscopicum TaxID=703497 RepID=A0A6A6UQL5_9PEZI|nr:phosphate:H+ symporter [Microthyrium microscopicum]
MSGSETRAFNRILRPDDIYDPEGTYWADLPVGRKVKFVNKVNNQEAKEEFAAVWSMFKKDPLAPFGAYFRNFIIPGMGLGLEGYVLFSIGNIKPLFQAAFPLCWGSKKICNPTWLAATEYLEICGIIVGQVSVGIIGDWLGRRWGLIQDATIMFFGLIMLIAAWGTTQNGWVICYAWSLFFYGIGVGGEYPMTATSGMENAVGSGKISTRFDRLHRGRQVTSAFLMQGWGQFFNQAILIILLLIFHHGSGNPPYSEVSAQWTYRISFVPPAIGTLLLIYFRVYKMRRSNTQLAAMKSKQKVTGYDVQSLKLMFRYFGLRVVGTAGAWYCNDVFFYGNKLFQSQFIAILTPNNHSVIVGWLWNLLNVVVSLFGYYLASFLVDNKLYGRKWMMIIGFMGDFILFVVPGFNYGYYSKAGIKSFQAMYFLSSFFNQFGPNSVTFLAAAEVYPVSVRATAHGFSAAVGKLGALHAAVMYNYTKTTQNFHIVPWFGLAGALLTWLFIPDTTGLDLKEAERRWTYIRAGREHDYHGIAIHPKHLSVWERFRGVAKDYDPDLDFQAKVAELRSNWEELQMKRAEEKLTALDEVDEEDWDPELHAYFSRTSNSSVTGFKDPIKESSEEEEKPSIAQ